MKICKICIDNAAKILPFLSEKDQYQILIGWTAFPMGNCNYIKRQLRKVRRKYKKTGQNKKVTTDGIYKKLFPTEIIKH